MTKPLTIEAICEAWSKTTPGPWEYDYVDHSVWGRSGSLLVIHAVESEDDGEAIVAAPEHIAFLLAENADLRAENKSLRESLKAMMIAGQDATRDYFEVQRELAAARQRIAELESERFKCNECGEPISKNRLGAWVRESKVCCAPCEAKL